MDLQELLKKQKARGFKKNIELSSNTLSISDYLSDPNSSRPYIDENTTRTLSIVKKNNSANTAQIKSLKKITQEENKPTDEQLDIAYHEKIEAADYVITKKTQPIEISPVKQPSIKDKKATQEPVSETQISISATQQLEPNKQNATQKFQSATHTTTQQFQTKHSRLGRPKITTFDYLTLVGNELNITNEIYSECLKSKSLETNYLEKNDFSQRVKVKLGAIRTSCTRLRAKGVLEDFIATKGRGSSWKFVLSENIYHQISMKNTLVLATISDTNRDTTILSSSSSNYLNKTTTQLPSDWKKIEYSELQKNLNIFNERFGLAQIKTIFKEAGELLSAADVQTSIENFTIGLNNFISKPTPGIYNRKVKIATLLECLKNGEKFVDPNVEAIKETMAQKALSEMKLKMAEQYYEPKFEFYFSSLSNEQAAALIPSSWKNSNSAWEHAVKTNNTIVQRSFTKDFAKNHFKKNIWPEVLEKLLIK